MRTLPALPRHGISRFLPLLAALLAVVVTGCGKKEEQQMAVPPPGGRGAMPGQTRPQPTEPGPDDKTDTRTKWVYDKGSYAKGTGDSWTEQNDETKKAGKPWEFRQTAATKEYIEIHDASRGVSLRLTDKSADARWDKDGKDAAWKPLHTGQWEAKK